MPGLTLSTVPVENQTAQLDMTLDIWEEDDGLGGWLEYDTGLFDRTTRPMFFVPAGNLEI